MTTENQHRRLEDCVSFRDMVEYVAESDARYHAARADSLLVINGALEKLEKSQDDSTKELREAFQNHEAWHRDYLERMLTLTAQNRPNWVGVMVAVLFGIIGNVVVIIVALHK